MEKRNDRLNLAAKRLTELYAESFGGKDSGRYRIPVKLICQLLNRRRLYEDDIRLLSRALFEHGFVLIDMGTFCVIMSANAFVNYRRANEECLKKADES